MGSPHSTKQVQPQTQCPTMDKQLLATNLTTTTTTTTTNNGSNTKNISSGFIHPCTGERFKMTYNSLEIQVHFKGTNTTKTLLMAPKDRDNKLQESGIIYRIKCPHINCPEENIGESGDRFKEHLRTPSPIHHHSNFTGHQVSPECFIIFDRESQGSPGT